MQKIIPQLLQPGDEVRIVAPARGIKIIGKECREIARQRLESWGLKVSYGKNATDENWDLFGSSPVAQRVDDLHEAFADPKVKGIMTMIGGANSNQLLPFLDYELIAKNPKVFCGFSDITALVNGIYAKTGLVTFLGPHFSSLGMLKGAEYTLENARKMLMGDGATEVEAAKQWSDDPWFMDQENRNFIDNEGYWTLQPGEAEGTIVGGNLGTFNLLLGTTFRPQFADPTILFVEDNFTSNQDPAVFERNLQALAYQEDFKNVKGLVIGRFQKASEMSREKLEYIIKNQAALKNLPVLANVDFGHTAPLLTIPVGGTARLDAGKQKLYLKI